MDKKPNLTFAHSDLKDHAPLGVLLANLGSTSSADAAGLRSFYSEFLADKRVIEVPRIIWNVILYCFILPFRPYVIAKQYQEIWTDEGSPLLVIADEQEAAVQAALERELGTGCVTVAAGMRYGQPSIASALERLKKAGAKRLIVLPLYPQPAAPTTASTFDAVADALRVWRDVPPVRFISGYADEPMFIKAIADSVRRFWAEHADEPRPTRLLISFHGVPRKTLLAGDPYHCWCLKTARLVGKELGLRYYNSEKNPDSFSHHDDNFTTDETTYGISYQSRFGFAEWVKPYSDATLEEWGKEGVESVDIVAPAFSVDCLETLEEISGQLKELFLEHGGKRLRYIPALNAQPEATELYTDLVLRNCLGWPEQRKMSKETERRLCEHNYEVESVDSNVCPHLKRAQRAAARATELDLPPLKTDAAVVANASESKKSK